MTEKTIIVKVQDLTKSFRIPLESSNGIKQKIINLIKGRKGYREFTPLNDISFEIEEGDFFGIVGRNGSGKSTLLKTIAGIYEPDKGAVSVNGTLVPFIELGVGFNPELTGRENVFLNGALLGFSHSEVESMYGEIVDFAELHDFMEERLKNYSSGMQVRLAFSIAIRAQSDILLLDEVLAVGDAAFQQKCFEYFGSLRQEKKTVILVTHDMSAVEKYCTKAILIEKGRIIKQGDNMDVADAYRQLFIDEHNSKEGLYEPGQSQLNEDVNHIIKITDMFITQSGSRFEAIIAKEPFEVNIEYEASREIGQGAIGINIVNSMGVVLMASGLGTIYDPKYSIRKGHNKIRFKINHNSLNQDTFRVGMAILQGSPKKNQNVIYQATAVTHFSVYGIKNRNHALIQSDVDIEAY